MTTVQLVAAGPRVDPPLERWVDLLVRLDWNVSIVVDGVQLMTEDMTAAELALALARWRARGMKAREVFEWDSTDDERLGLIRLWPDGPLWRIGSCLLPEGRAPQLAQTDLDLMLDTFSSTVIDATLGATGFDMTPLLDGTVDPLDSLPNTPMQADDASRRR